MKSARIAIAAAVLAAALTSAPGARAADPDPWFGRDKALHFGVSAGLASAGYAVSAAVFDARGYALIGGGTLALAAGAAKEVADLAGLGDPSWKDFAWDVIGTAAGLAVAWGVDLVVRGVSEAHPMFVSPSAGREGAGGGLRVAF